MNFGNSLLNISNVAIVGIDLFLEILNCLVEFDFKFGNYIFEINFCIFNSIFNSIFKISYIFVMSCIKCIKCILKIFDQTIKVKIVVYHCIFKIVNCLFKFCSDGIAVTITNLERDACAVSIIVSGFSEINNNRDLIFIFIIESEHKIMAYGNLEIFVVTANRLTGEHLIVKGRTSQFIGIGVYPKKNIVAGANNGNGRRQAKRKRCFIDYVVVDNGTLIVADTFDDDGDRTCVFKVSGYSIASLEGNDVISVLNERYSAVQSLKGNNNIGFLFLRIINGILGNVCIIEVQLCRQDLVYTRNAALIVADTFNYYGDLTYVSKVVGFFQTILTVSEVSNSEISVFNEHQSADRNHNGRHLRTSVKVGEAVNVNVIVKSFIVYDLNTFDHISLRNGSEVVVLTFDGNGDCACIGKVVGFFQTVLTVSLEFNSVISVKNESQAVNLNRNNGLMLLCVIDHVAGNGDIRISNFGLDDLISLCNGTAIVADTFYDDSNHTGIGKVIGYLVASLEGNGVISAGYESQTVNLNGNVGLLFSLVIDHVIKNGHVIQINRCTLDHVFHRNGTFIVTDTGNRYVNRAFIGKVGGFFPTVFTVSLEFNSVVSVKNEQQSADRNHNLRNLNFSVIGCESVNINVIVKSVTVDNFNTFNRISLFTVAAVVIDTYYNDSDLTCVSKVSGYIIASLEGNSVINVLNKSQTVNYNRNNGLMLLCIIDHIAGNEDIFISNHRHGDRISFSNRFSCIGIVIADTFDDYSKFTYVCKCSSHCLCIVLVNYNTVFLVDDDVIFACNGFKTINFDGNIKFMRICVIRSLILRKS